MEKIRKESGLTYLKDLSKEGNKSTKLGVLLALLLISFSFLFGDMEFAFMYASLFALLIVLAIDLYVIIPMTNPYVWSIIKWLTLAGVILLTLIG